MNALKVNFAGPKAVSIDWNQKISGGSAVAQRAGISVMTRQGSDKFLPDRGTQVTNALFSYGVFDLQSMQHVLNFGGLKARSDMQDDEAITRAPEDRVAAVRLTLIGVKDNSAQVGIQVTNQAGQTTKEITSIT